LLSIGLFHDYAMKTISMICPAHVTICFPLNRVVHFIQ